MDDELRAWFDGEGLMRYAGSGDERGEVVELACGPMLALGARDEDFVGAPNPDAMGYPGKPLRDMSMEEYNQFLYRWFEAAVAAGDVRCANCGKRILPDDDLPDADTWDAILVEKELVAWMLVHFDCKRWLAKKLKGVHPFDLEPREPPRYDLSQVEVPPLPAIADAEADDAASPNGGHGTSGK
ncbi:MAG: hypothetical protein ACRDHP_19745 [Ktedonobacterales bacterium]